MLLDNKLFVLFIMSPSFCFVYSVAGVPPFENQSVRWAIVWYLGNINNIDPIIDVLIGKLDHRFMRRDKYCWKIVGNCLM